MKLAAAYVRVSTEEQALHGYSVQAQREAIQAYAKENGYKIIGEYADEGVSGRKPYNKRPALSRFMSDIQNGMKVDVLLFTKLDRLFRSVRHYYKAAEILDASGVAWKAIQENYETETANGRFTVNIMLSVAENEADRTGERIKAVNVSKVQHGQVVTGMVPFGYMTADHRVVPDPEKADIAREIFRIYRERHSSTAVVRTLREKYGLTFSKQWAMNCLRNTLYKGEYRGNPAYCEALISPEEFDAIQETLKEREVTQTKTGRVYLFTGLLQCAECGGSLSIVVNHAESYYYRCGRHTVHPGQCPHRKHIHEDVLEKWLLLHVKTEFEIARAKVRTECEHAKRSASDRAGILRKLQRLKDLYVNEMIDLLEYRRDYEEYQTRLAEIDRIERERPRTPDFDGISKKLVTLDEAYQTMDRPQKQTFWRQIIRKIVIDKENNIQVYFL